MNWWLRNKIATWIRAISSITAMWQTNESNARAADLVVNLDTSIHRVHEEIDSTENKSLYTIPAWKSINYDIHTNVYSWDFFEDNTRMVDSSIDMLAIKEMLTKLTLDVNNSQEEYSSEQLWHRTIKKIWENYVFTIDDIEYKIVISKIKLHQIIKFTNEDTWEIAFKFDTNLWDTVNSIDELTDHIYKVFKDRLNIKAWETGEEKIIIYKRLFTEIVKFVRQHPQLKD